MSGIENSSKPERDLFRMLSWLSQHFLKILWRLTGHCLIFNKIEQFQAVSRKTVLGKRQILISNKNQSENQPQLNMKTSLQVK